MSELVYFPITNAASRTLALNVLFLVLATFAVVARTLSRINSCLSFWWDDWLLFIAWLQVTFKSSYIASLACSKASIIRLYMRIFTAHGNVRLFSHLALCVILAWALAFWIARMTICQPILATVKHCGDEKALVNAMNATNIVTDMIVIAIPQYPLWRLRLPRRDKLGLMSCFLVGIVCIVVAIFRILNNLNTDFQHNETGNLVQTTLLTSLEPCLAIICASMPMCRRFLSWPRPWWSRRTPRSLCVRSAFARATPQPDTPVQQQLPLMAVVVEPDPVVIRGHSDDR
ncbi:hypothetical protein MCOR25_011208 [Pyricularia grisea]|nr:hypothetical protein MCOR25_011208 [Pyricularia grisea]